MKFKKVFVAVLSSLCVSACSSFAFACSCNGEPKEPIAIVIISDDNVTIETGAEYELVYTCDGTATVTANGGTYDSATGKFTADTAGDYTLTITAEDGTTKTVTIHVVVGADKTALKAAIEDAKALVATDYDDSWANVRSALRDAENMVAASGKSQAEVDVVTSALASAIKSLKALKVEKVDLSVEGQIIVSEDEKYYAGDYKNYTDIYNAIKALNEDETVTLNSVYTAKLRDILKDLISNPELTVTGAPDGIMLVSELVPITFTAKSEEGSTIVCTLKVGNGEAQTLTADSEDKYAYTPAAFGEEYEITVTATVGEGNDAKTKTLTYSGKVQEANYKSNVASAQVANNTISFSDKNLDWATAKGKKVELNDLVFNGDVTVCYDINFAEVTGENSVLGIFFLNDRGMAIDNWAVVNYGQSCIEVAANDGDVNVEKFRTTVSLSLDTTYHLKATRSVKDVGGANKGFLTIWLLDDNGRILATAESPVAKDYAGGVKIGVQAENVKGTVSNISVSVKDGADIIDMTALRKALAACTLTYAESDYTDDELTEYKAAYSAANITFGSSNLTQGRVKDVTDALNEKFDGVKNAFKEPDYITIDVEEPSFTYGNDTYYKVNYKEEGYAAVIEAINDLRTQGVKPISVYEQNVKALLASLIQYEAASIEVNVTNAPDGVLLVQEIPETPIIFDATVSAGTEVIWTLNGEVLEAGDAQLSNNGLTLTYVPVNGDYRVEAVAKSGEAVSSPEVFTGGYYKTNYAVNSNYSEKITVDENNVIKVTDGNNDWNPERGRKVVLDNINLEGDFVVTLKGKFVTNGVFALFLLDSNGEYDGMNYVVLNNKNNNTDDRFIGVGINQDGGEDKAWFMDSNAIDNGNLFTLRVSRTGDNLKGEIVDDGTAIWTFDKNGVTTRRITLGFQFEHCEIEVSDIKVVKGTVISKDDIDAAKKAIAERDAYINLTTLYVNYEEEEADAYVTTRQAIFDVYYNDATTKVEIAKAVADYNAAYTALLGAKIELVKAEVTANSFTYKDNTYSSADYTNVVGEGGGVEYVLAKVTALNADTEIDNVYDYDNAIKALIAELEAVLQFSVAGAPASGNVLVNSLPNYTLDVDTNATSITWTVNGEVLSSDDEMLTNNGTTLNYTATEYGEFSIKVDVEDDKGHTDSKEWEGEFINAQYTNNKKDGITVANNVISVNESYSWDDTKGKKVTFNDIYLVGEFSVSFDLEFTGDSGIMALFFLTDNGIYDDNESGLWTAINKQGNFIEMAVNNKNDRRYQMPDGTTDGLMHIKVSRYLAEDGLYYWAAQLLDDNGNPLPLGWNTDRQVWDNGWQLGSVFNNAVYTANDSKDAGNDWQNDYKGSIKLGIQAENGTFTVSNLVVASKDSIVDKRPLRDAIASVSKITLGDYTSVTVSDLNAALTFANEIANNHTPNQDEADTACTGLLAAIEALALIPPEEYVAEVDGNSYFAYGGKEYIDSNYSNFGDVLAEIKALETDEAIVGKTAYDEAITAIIATLESAVKVEISGIANGNLIVKDLLTYTLTANATSSTNNNPAFVYEWTVNGKVVEDATSEEYTFEPELGIDYVITVKATDTANDNTFEVATTNVRLTESRYVIPSEFNNKVTVDDKNTVSSVESVNWPDIEGKKVLFEDLVFNGSFSVAMDVNVKQWDDPNVLTFHVFNADTYKNIDGGKVSYGALLLGPNPTPVDDNNRDYGNVRLEAHDGANKYGIDEAAAKAIQDAKKATLKLTVIKYADNYYHTIVSVLNPLTGKWIDYDTENATKEYPIESGLVVGLNIEHIRADFSNFRYELLAGGVHNGKQYLAGALVSKVELGKALEEYGNVNLDEYLNGEAKNDYTAALTAAQLAYKNNSVDNQSELAGQLADTYTALQADKKPIDVVIEGYKYYYNAVGAEIVANFGDNEVSDVSWTYTFLSTEEDAEEEVKTTAGEKLTIDAGKYTNVKLNFTYNGKQYTYDYYDYDFVIDNIVPLNSSVLVGSDSDSNWGSVTVDGNNATTKADMDWGRKDAIYLDGVSATNFEMSFDVKYVSGDANVMAINLFGTSATLVCRFKDGGQIGFDEFNYVNDSGEDKKCYIHVDGGEDVLKSEAGVTFTVKVSRNDDGTYNIVFTVKSGNTVLATREWEGFDRSSDSSTEIKFTVESTVLEFKNFSIMYN